MSSSIRDILIRHILSRSNGDISALNIPQDTAFSYKTQEGEMLHIRVSTVTSIGGYSIVMRLLTMKVLDGVESYIKNPALRNGIMNFLKQRNGMFVATGPTGSGKTTFLYHILQDIVHRDHAQEKIMTIEDPVEVILPGITQVQVNEKIGLDFEDIIKVSLRQNPDVLMLGEIRDTTSAMMAMRASITGVMVFATIHSRTAEEVVFRLRDLGVPSAMIANSLKFVVSMRLIKKLCESCKVKFNDVEERSSFEKYFPHLSFEERDNLFSPVGCEFCHSTGYNGFIPVYEFFSMTKKQHHALAESNFSEFKRLLDDEVNGETLFNQVSRLFKLGVTSIEEVYSVIFV
ncbi:MAG: Flp pilus assembly complex ATPase component TadA [Gammaproteobacteria bacterium]|nr:Flp pilus assembly complex ATPase component TadA [Gammaproteobacteria bacterium]